MAGRMRLIIVLLFAIRLSTAVSITININVCRSERGIILKCEWRGEVQYAVDVLLREEILSMSKLTESSTLFVPAEFVGNLAKIEILEGDAPCNVIAPLNVAVSRKRCVSKFHKKIEKTCCQSLIY